MLEQIGRVEQAHEQRYKALLANVGEGKVFAKEDKKLWRCRNCGFAVEASKAPDTCPLCKHPQAYFEMAADNY
jgi:rubrerythrin